VRLALLPSTTNSANACSLYETISSLPYIVFPGGETSGFRSQEIIVGLQRMTKIKFVTGNGLTAGYKIYRYKCKKKLQFIHTVNGDKSKTA